MDPRMPKPRGSMQAGKSLWIWLIASVVWSFGVCCVNKNEMCDVEWRAECVCGGDSRGSRGSGGMRDSSSGGRGRRGVNRSIVAAVSQSA